MRHMKHVTATVAIAALAVAATFQPAYGQRGPRGPQGFERAAGVERAIRLADELELSSEQRSQLETLRQDLLAQRQAKHHPGQTAGPCSCRPQD